MPVAPLIFSINLRYSLTTLKRISYLKAQISVCMCRFMYLLV